MTDPVIFLIDDDDAVRDSLCAFLQAAGHRVEDYSSARKFLEIYSPERIGCLIVDIRMPDMDGIALQEEMRARKWNLPTIVMTGHGDVPLAVRAMKAGARDFLEKPLDHDQLQECIARALEVAVQSADSAAVANEAQARVETLTVREREVLEHLVAGHANKVIAHELGISPRTVEIHRAHLSEKLRSRTLSDIIRLALAAGVKAR